MFRESSLRGPLAAALLSASSWGICCGSVDDGTEGTASGGASSGASTATGGDSTGSGGAGGTSEASGGRDGTSPPVLCGGAYSRECGDGYFCRFTTGCGTVARCTRRPKTCDDVFEPVCGCDGTTYSNECAAYAAGVAVRDPGPCDEDEQFPCGPYQCARTSYCLDKNGTGTSTIWQHACLTPPTECADGPSCDCLSDVTHCYPRQHTCQEGTGVTLTCN